MTGPTIAAIGFALFAVPSLGVSYWSGVFPAVCVLGFGMAITVAPLTTTVMNAVGEEHAGTASGINNAMARTAGLLAIAIFGVVLTHVFNGQLDRQLAQLSLPPDIIEAVRGQRSRLAGISLPPGISPGLSTSLKRAIGLAFVAGFRQVMLLSAALALASALVAWVSTVPRSPRVG